MSDNRHSHRDKKRSRDAKPDGQANSQVPLAKRGLTPAGSDFVAECKWLNKLPSPPHSSKMLIYPFESDRFVKYKQPSSLETTHRFDLHTELDLGLDLDLTDVDAWEGPGFLSSLQTGVKRHKSDKADRELAVLAFSAMPPEDRAIFADPREKTILSTTPEVSADDKATRVKQSSRTQPTSEYDRISESEESTYMREILGSFEHADTLEHDGAWKHPTQSNLKPTAIWSVLPTASLWNQSLYDVQLEVGHTEVLEHRHEMLLKGFKVRAADAPIAEDIMAVISPSITDPTYKWIKEYNFAKLADSESHLILFVPHVTPLVDQLQMQPNPATFKPLDGRIQLKKRSRASAEDVSRTITVQSIPSSHPPPAIFSPPV